MFRVSFCVVSLIVLFLMAPRTARSQASEKLDEKTKAMESAQQKSWEQVDQINNETDKTKARRQQAQGAVHEAQKSGYSSKKAGLSTKGAYKKPSSATKRKKASPKKD